MNSSGDDPPAASKGGHYRFDGFQLDVDRRELRSIDETLVPLSAKAFDALVFLIEHRERVVGREELLATIWAGRVVEDNNLAQAIAAMRRALGTDPSNHRYIVTVPGRGYRFVSTVQDNAEASAPFGLRVAANLVAEPQPQAPLHSHTDGWGRLGWVSGLVIAALALLLGTAWQRFVKTPQPPTQTSLAVLPFRSLTSGPRDPLLELGLAETLISRLGRAPQLRIISLGSTESAVEAGADALATGRKLGATHVVAGTTQRVGDRVRVSVRLSKVNTGETLWSDTFDDRIDRVFTLQDRITGGVTRALDVPAVVLVERAITPCDGEDPIAYRAWLRGRYLAQRPTQANLEKAIRTYRHAIERDTACTRAYAGISLAYRGMAHSDRDPREVFPLAKAAAAQALRIDPDSPEGLMAHGRVQHLFDWNWESAEASFKRALELNPSLVEARFAYAHLLTDLGRFDEGLEQGRQALELDPLSPYIAALLGGFHSAARQPEAASKMVAHALELQPDFWIALLVRGGLALDRGEASNAVEDFAKAAERSRGASQMLAMLAVAQSAAGQAGEAAATLAALEARAAEGYVPATSLAAAHVAVGESDRALALLERAYEERDIRMAFLKVDARWNSLRGDPRFQALARRLDLEGGQGYGRF